MSRRASFAILAAGLVVPLLFAPVLILFFQLLMLTPLAAICC